MNELPTDKTLVLASRSGKNNLEAINTLRSNGYENLVILKGGIKAWQAKGYKVVVDGIGPSTKSCCSKQKNKGKGCCSKKGNHNSSCSNKNKSM